MGDNRKMKQAANEELKRALFETIGPNDPYPVPEDIAAHKRRAKLRLEYPNMTFSSQYKLTKKRERNAN